MTQYSGKVIRKTPVTPTQTSASGVWKLNEQAAAIRNNSWPIAGVPDPISRSVRLRSSASAYFNRTFGTPTNEKIWTWSAWVKRGSSLATFSCLFSASTGASPAYDGFRFNGSDQLQFFTGGAVTVNLVTNAVYRDPSAWYHIVLSYNATTTTVTIYVNGVAQTTTGTTISNTTYSFNHASTLHDIGTQVINGAPQAQYFDGYITEVNFIDGQALTPSSFGTTDTATGAWIPMAYTGTYGANGFYLNFKDNTSTTTIGYDYSGNSNNWTANNISLTAGSTYDSMLDVPTPWVGYSTTTDTSAVTRGNYSVMNPLNVYGATVTDGNLQCATTNISNDATNFSTVQLTSGKWYAEFLLGGSSSTSTSTGVGVSAGNTGTTYNRLGQLTNGMMYKMDGNKESPSGITAYGATYTYGDLIGIALDLDASPPTVTFYKNNTSQGSINLNSGSASTGYVMGCTVRGSAVNFIANFGQRPLTYTPPTGYKTLCTTNLTTPTITNGANYMAATTWTGNASNRSIVNSANNSAGVTFQPDLAWIKVRSNSGSHWLSDSVRGATKYLSSNGTTAENTLTDELTSFTSNGFNLGVSVNSFTNYNTWTYVGWQWQAGQGTTSSNTSGSITSTVSVNTTAGFSVVTYTGTGANATVGHGLGVAPSMIIAKHRNAVDNWIVYHTSLGGSPNYLWLNLTSAAGTSSAVWNTFPTSSVFGVGTDNLTNLSGGTYVAYCWAAVAGYSAFGSYTGNGSSDGAFVYLGFRPRFVMFKRTDTTSNWLIIDSSRGTYNSDQNRLFPNLSNAEDTSENFDLLSNGFKLRDAAGSMNASGGTYIYAAFAENPFKYSNAR